MDTQKRDESKENNNIAGATLCCIMFPEDTADLSIIAQVFALEFCRCYMYVFDIISRERNQVADKLQLSSRVPCIDSS